MRTQFVLGHQFLGYLFGKRCIKPAGHINRRQFLVFALVVCLELRTLTGQFSFFRVCLRMNGDVLPRSHRHGPSRQTRRSCNQDVMVSSMCGRNTKHKA